jgi:hypothetical protein
MKSVRCLRVSAAGIGWWCPECYAACCAFVGTRVLVLVASTKVVAHVAPQVDLSCNMVSDSDV